MCNHNQNCYNQPHKSTNTSGYKGVSLVRQTKRWEARIRHLGKLLHLGCYDTPEDAARVYDDAARKYHGEFARLNFPIPTHEPATV
jgi:hypothetical protein